MKHDKADPAGVLPAAEASIMENLRKVEQQMADLERSRGALLGALRATRSGSLTATDTRWHTQDIRNSLPANTAETSPRAEGTSPSPPEGGASPGVKGPVPIAPTTALRAAAHRQKGNRCCYLLAVQSFHDEFGRAWNQAPSVCVALGRGYCIVYEDGSATWWDIPKSLDAKLRSEKESASLRYVALGCEDSYFVKYASGKVEWCATEEFGAAVRRGMKDQRMLVERVAFGPDRSWAILWSDGRIDFKNVPRSFARAVEALPPGEEVKDVSLGPEGEWFVILRNNSVRADNLGDSIYATLNEIQQRGWRLRTLVFGENGSYFMRYWDGQQQQ
eukprot:Polyplicarium_translucidae@DN2192_c0_g1_i2.p1